VTARRGAAAIAPVTVASDRIPAVGVAVAVAAAVVTIPVTMRVAPRGVTVSIPVPVATTITVTVTAVAHVLARSRSVRPFGDRVVNPDATTIELLRNE
jgi:hypothetical protein